MDLIRLIKIKCMDEGLSLTKLCKQVGVKRETISRYEKKLPIPLVTVSKLLGELDNMKSNRLKLKECYVCGEVYSNSKTFCPQCKTQNDKIV